MANYTSEFTGRTWGDLGIAPPESYSYTDSVPPIEEYDDWLTYNTITDLNYLIQLTNKRLESSSGTAFPSGPEDGQVFWDSDDASLFIYDESYGDWREIALGSSASVQQIETLQNNGEILVITDSGSTKTWSVGTVDAHLDVEAAIDWADANALERATIYLPWNPAGGSGPVPITQPITRTPTARITFKGGRFKNEIVHAKTEPEGATPGVFDIGDELPEYEEFLMFDAGRREEEIIVADSTQYNPGDLICVQSDTLTESSGPGFGEAHEVVAIDSGTSVLTLRSGLTEPHLTTDNALVYRWSPCEVVFDGIHITADLSRTEGDEYMRGIRLMHCINSRVKNADIRNQVVAGIKIWGGYDVQVVDSRLDNNIRMSSSGYGVCFSREVNEGAVVRCKITRSRHCVASYAANGNSARGWPQFTVRDCELHVGRGDNHCIDAHKAVHTMDIMNTTVNGESPWGEQGIAVITGALHTTVKGCTFRNVLAAVGHRAGEEPNGTLRVTGTDAYQARWFMMFFGDTRNFTEVWVNDCAADFIDNDAFFTVDGGHKLFSVTNCQFAGKGNGSAIFGGTPNETFAEHLIVSNNVFSDFDDGMDLREIAEGTIDNNKIYTSGTGISLVNCANVWMHHNTIVNERGSNTFPAIESASEAGGFVTAANNRADNNRCDGFPSMLSGATVTGSGNFDMTI